MQHFDGDLSPQLNVVREVHLRRRAGTDGGDEAIATTEHAADVVGHARHDHQAPITRWIWRSARVN
jgi:hypothetical protein